MANAKCAPHREYDGLSCLTLDELIGIVKAFNRGNPNNQVKLQQNFEILNPRKYKEYIISELNDRIKDCNGNQMCWLHKDFIKKYMDESTRYELTKTVFRPSGPNGKFEWLNTINLNEIMEQYQLKYPDFRYLGTVPIDFDNIYEHIRNINIEELYKSGIKKLGIIFNLDDSKSPGSHWVAMYVNIEEKQLYYFDSYGIKPEYRIRKLMRRICDQIVKMFKITPDKATVEYNDIRHQYKGSECGVYSADFIIRMLQGESFKKLTEDKQSDDKVNLRREDLFYNVNFPKKKLPRSIQV